MRYEYGAWPRWRVDKNVRYQLKGLFHVKQASTETRSHFARMTGYVKRYADGDRSSNAVRTLSLAAVGDVMWIGKNSAQSLSEHVKRIIDVCDIRLANLETPIDISTPVPDFTYDLFNSSVDLLDPWTHHGKPTVFSICNNHGLDQGVSGVKNTRNAVTARDGAYCVGGLDAEDAIVQLETASVRVAITGMTFGSNRYAGTVAGIPQ
ncbi:MAG TPA: CapA family protein, partial [Candidatus Kapabacteria bacterium]|nr:CapA family protein [Candidatus Kapabacteria bacterium]